MKISIKSKLFLVIFIVVSLNIVITIIFGSSFLEMYYVHTKKNELKSYKEEFVASYASYTNSGDMTEIYEIAQECGRNNTSVLIYNSVSNTIDYFGNTMPGEMGGNNNLDQSLSGQYQFAQNWIYSATAEGILDKLSVQDDYTTEGSMGDLESIYYYTTLNEHVYLFLETPKAYIETTANTALQFFIYLSLGTLLVGIIVTYFVSSRIAKPIKQIDDTAQKIAAMDFSERCEIHTGDEVEALANSVNIMAEKLKQNIDILKHDLEREEETNRIRREFVSNISHDFKTPLSLISAYTEALKDNHEPERVEQIYDIILEQSSTMNRLVNQLLTLNQLESGVMSYNMSFFSLNELLQTVIHSCEILLEKNNIDLKAGFKDEFIVNGDYTRITQVITNLLENAIKYVDQKKIIRIWIEQHDNKIRTCIFNSHRHLTDEELSSVFELFYRADKSRNASAKSYGLGLAIVSAIIEAHNNEAGVYNTENGVVFWFELESFELDDEELE